MKYSIAINDNEHEFDVVSPLVAVNTLLTTLNDPTIEFVRVVEFNYVGIPDTVYCVDCEKVGRQWDLHISKVILGDRTVRRFRNEKEIARYAPIQ